MFAEHREQFIANNFYDLLVGRKLQQNFLAKRFGANIREKFIGHADGDVAFEHGFTDLRERGVQMFFGELALTAKIFERALKFVC